MKSIEKNEHGDEIDADWEPGSPSLKGANPGEALAVNPPPPARPDELRHSERRKQGLDNDDPDPGYDPDDDDLDPVL